MAGTPEQELAKLRAELARLNTAMGSGVLTVEQADNGGRTTYRSYAEMQKARSDLSRRIGNLDASLSGAVRRRTHRFVLVGRSGF
ncbi:hypothetical protein MMB17_18480 [Methylobacterium organophilum]|uniref:phage head-tail joining protein n=1 Tax=Methylobacterium organophilum TaxID=410 RepID=UPI001F143D3C|nr:hypothetical protein [Methylobacterium organophilum]UMY16649.1 hypothetical protein MMB17_18480 [Methylobacterium organophilum]